MLFGINSLKETIINLLLKVFRVFILSFNLISGLSFPLYKRILSSEFTRTINLSTLELQNPIEKIVLEKYSTRIQEHPQLANTSTTIQNPKIDKSKGAIFFDRDGTINEDVGYLDNINDIQIPKENLETISTLSELNFFNIIVSNQSGVGLGYFNTKVVKKLMIKSLV